MIRTSEHRFAHLPWIDSFFILILSFLLQASTAYAQSDAPDTGHGALRTTTSAQVGFEYDSNVYKAFGGTTADGLTRLLLKNQGTLALSDDQWLFNWDYQAGGKKYFVEEAQDMLIQFLEIPITLRPSDYWQLTLMPDVKFQKERSKLDSKGLDINEDFLSTETALRLTLLPSSWPLFELQGSWNYFHFFPNNSYRFHRQLAGIRTEKNISPALAMGLQYFYARQQFTTGNRSDRDHHLAVSLRHLQTPYLTLRYAFEDTDSNDPRFSFRKHIVTFITSLAFGQGMERYDTVTMANNQSEPRFSLHLMVSFQIKQFPAIFDFEEEGQRFLLTGSEDESFNSFIAKFTYHPLSWLAIEAKLTRYSNELSSLQSDFSRSLMYMGTRLTL